MFLLKEVMPKDRKKVGFALPPSFADALDQLVVDRGLGEREKWLVVCGMILAFAEMTPEDQKKFIERIHFARLPGRNFEDLLPHRGQKASKKLKAVDPNSSGLTKIPANSK